MSLPSVRNPPAITQGKQQRGVLWDSLEAVAPGTSTEVGKDARAPPHNWAAIAASPSKPQTSISPNQPREGTGGTRESTRRTVAQSPGLWNNVDRLCKPSSEATETAKEELILGTPE